MALFAGIDVGDFKEHEVRGVGTQALDTDNVETVGKGDRLNIDDDHDIAN